MSTPVRDEDLLGVLLRLQREGGLQFALTNEIVSTVIFVRSAYYQTRHFCKNSIAYDTLFFNVLFLILFFNVLICSNLASGK
jgi:hypothetical protein